MGRFEYQWKTFNIRQQGNVLGTAADFMTAQQHQK